MEQVLTSSVVAYFRNIHNRVIDNSNALQLLITIKEFEQIHLDCKNNFKHYHGNNFESIEEVIQQYKYHLEQSHNIYRAKGNLITPNTKQYTIEQKNKEYNKDYNIEDVADKLHGKLIKKNSTPIKKTKKSIEELAKEMLALQNIKDNLKKR